MMSGDFPFSAGVMAMILVVGAIYILLALLPLLYPIYISFRARLWLPRRLLFVGVIAAISYGTAHFFLVAIGLPLQAYEVFIAPPMEASDHPYGRWLVSIPKLISGWGWLLLLVPPAVIAVILTRYLVNRWPRIMESLYRRPRFHRVTDKSDSRLDA